jgi:hypothetical protein
MERRNIVTRRTLTSIAIAVLSLTVGTIAQANWQGWTKMHRQITSAHALLHSNLSNGLNPIGTVSDLLLTPDHKKVEYVLYDSSYPFTLYGGGDGFVNFSDVRILGDAALMTNIIVNEDLTRAPNELELTASEAQGRLVSRLIGNLMYFPNGHTRRIRDVLIDRTSGVVEYYVVEMSPDTVFRAEPRAVPADDVSIDKGRVSTRLTMDKVEAMKEIAPEYL